jgi:hypothetical protein
MKLYEMCIRFAKNITTIIPDEQMTKIKLYIFRSYRTL